MSYKKDCIAAIATPLVKSGLGVVRLSGEGVIKKVSKIFKPAKRDSLTNLKGYEAAYGFVVDFDGNRVDDAVALVFVAPHSYTGEDVVELSCHGGLAILKVVLKMCFQVGCRPALNGEFTKRAFLNNKLSLTQAEAVVELINAESNLSLKAATNLKKGELFKKTQDVCKKLLELNSNIEASLNYPDEEAWQLETKQMLAIVNYAKNELTKLIINFEKQISICEGIGVILIGQPNVGKSTLMNLIAEQEVSIVSEISGTTRDIIIKNVELDGIKFKFIDTAGIRQTLNEVEKKGIEKAQNELKQAKVVLYVVDITKGFDSKILVQLQKQADILKILVLNKIDLLKELDMTKFNEFKENFDVVIKTTKHDLKTIEKLKQVVVSVVKNKFINFNVDVFVNDRQKILIEKTLQDLKDVEFAICNSIGLDAVSSSLELAIDNVLELNGKKVTEAIVDEIFSKFCVGK